MATANDIAARLVSMVRAGQFAEAYSELFSTDLTSVEPHGDSPVSKGMDAVLQKAKWWVDNFEMHSFESSEPFVNGSQFAVVMTLDATNKMNGERSAMKEIGLYTVENGKIVEERFFFGG